MSRLIIRIIDSVLFFLCYLCIPQKKIIPLFCLFVCLLLLLLFFFFLGGGGFGGGAGGLGGRERGVGLSLFRNAVVESVRITSISAKVIHNSIWYFIHLDRRFFSTDYC